MARIKDPSAGVASYADPNSIPATQVFPGLLARIRQFFRNLGDPNTPLLNFGGGSEITTGGKAAGKAAGGLSNLWGKLAQASNNFQTKPFLTKEGMNLGQLSRIGMGAYQGVKATKGLIDNGNADNDLRSLKDDIMSEINTNPMYDMYMDASDEKLLREMKNGSMGGNNFGESVKNVFTNLPQTLLSTAIGAFTGGPAGAAIAGIGGLTNSAISGYGRGTQQNISKLQGLYDKLRRAGQDYRDMKRPSNIRRAGLSTRYFNQLY